MSIAPAPSRRSPLERRADDDLPDWLDPDTVMQARVRGRAVAVPAAPTRCNFNKQKV